MSFPFVDRTEELKEIRRYISSQVDVLVYGLRGVGKTSLLERLHDILIKEGKRVIFIDGYEILSPEDIFRIVSKSIGVDGREAIQELLKKSEYIIIIDEFTAFVEALSRHRPFSSVVDVVKSFRSMLRDRRKKGGESIILSSSAIGFVKKVTMKYFSPLFREFKLFYLGPLPLEAVYNLATYFGLKRDVALKVAEFSCGNPYYARKIIERIIASNGKPNEVVFDLIGPQGDLDIYFMALAEKLSPEERFILHLISRGYNRFYQVEEKLYKDPTPYFKKLEENGLIARIKKGRKHSEYILLDKLFQAWLQNQDIPTLGKMSKETIVVSSLGFEALVREILRSITFKIEVIDHLGQKVELPPFKTVYNLKKSDYEIDAIAVSGDSKFAFEIHFWGPAKYKKILQLDRNSKKYEEESGEKIAEKIVISYHGYELSEEEKEKTRRKKIKLLTSQHLREIQKNMRIKLIS